MPLSTVKYKIMGWGYTGIENKESYHQLKYAGLNSRGYFAKKTKFVDPDSCKINFGQLIGGKAHNFWEVLWLARIQNKRLFCAECSSKHMANLIITRVLSVTWIGLLVQRRNRNSWKSEKGNSCRSSCGRSAGRTLFAVIFDTQVETN